MAYKNHPIAECIKTAERVRSQHPGSAYFQKWTCGGCGRRITGNTPNKFFANGHCEDCGHVTNLEKAGCNYAVHLVVGGLASTPTKGSA